MLSVLGEMCTSIEGSCYIENLHLFPNFQQWEGVQDKDMVGLNACPLVNSTGKGGGGGGASSAVVFLRELKQPVDEGFNVGLTEIRPQQLTANVGKHSGPPFLLSGTPVRQGERC